MEYNRILRRVWVEIGESKHALSFSLSVFERLDSMANGKLIQIIASYSVLPVTILTEGFIMGLRQCDKSLTDGMARSLCEKFVLENGIQKLSDVFYGCLGTSGLMGAKATKRILDSLGAEDGVVIDNDEDEGKNVEKPEG